MEYLSLDGRLLMVLEVYISAVLQDFQEEIVGQIQAMIYRHLTNYFVSLLALMEHTMIIQLKAVFHVELSIAQFVEILLIASIASHNIWQIPRENANYAVIPYHFA